SRRSPVSRARRAHPVRAVPAPRGPAPARRHPPSSRAPASSARGARRSSRARRAARPAARAARPPTSRARSASDSSSHGRFWRPARAFCHTTGVARHDACTREGTIRDGQVMTEIETLLGLLVAVVVLATASRWLGLPGDEAHEREADLAEMIAAQAALERLDALAPGSGVAPALIDVLRSRYAHLAQHGPDHDDVDDERRHAFERRLRRELIEAGRESVIALRDRGIIGDDALRDALRDLD